MNPPMDCPRCGQAAVVGPTCPRCGVIVAKARAAADRRAAARAPETAPAAGAPAASARETRGGNWLVTLSGLAVVLVAGLVVARRVPGPARPGGVPPLTPPPAAAAPALAPDAPPPTFASPPPPAVAEIRDEVASLEATDRGLAEALALRLAAPGGLTSADVLAAEALLSRHPDEKGLRDLLEAVLEAVAANEAGRRQFAEGAAHLRRAAEVQPGSVRPSLALAQLHLTTGDWAGAEAACRTVLALEPRNAGALRALGFALLRQDRNREALDVLRAALEIEEDPVTRGLLERLQKGMADERGMTEQKLSHFNVRYDGETQDAVGREILRALERHYATLVSALDYEPSSTVPVILFSQQAYYDAAGAPAWSGGAYDNFDGRIRIPIGGLTATLTPDIDQTLLHELTHAFIAERTRGVAPREIHEGLAQYMEGKRTESMLTPEQMTGLADGRLRGVGGFYLRALSFVEYLVAQRGTGGMNELLRVMGETGNVDEAFRQVHATTYAGATRAWQERLRQQHGS